MIIQQMSGGLGNQMFQYALYLKLKSLGREVKFDDVMTYELDNARPIQLSVFGITYPRATAEEIIEMRDSSSALKDKIRRKLKGRNLKQYNEVNYSYDEHVLEVDDTYLVGLFQTDKYFSDIADEVRRVFTFREDLITDEVRSLEKEILNNKDSVSIHVRRGDYLNSGILDVFGDLCTDEYYDVAIKHILDKHPESTFYLFTNDQDWADYFVSQHEAADIRVVRCNTEYTGYLDMYLMTKCRHHIMANSSFSWWGGYLGSDQSGTTIAPKVWINNEHCQDIHTDKMVLIDNQGKIQG